jgi:hypothetical protein
LVNINIRNIEEKLKAEYTLHPKHLWANNITSYPKEGVECDKFTAVYLRDGHPKN